MKIKNLNFGLCDSDTINVIQRQFLYYIETKIDVSPITVSVRAAIPSTAILVHAVMTQIAETDATVTVTETTTGGMEFEPEMKVDKKDLLLLNKDHHLHLLTMLEIKDFPVPLIKDQVLMLLFLLETQEINEYKKMSN